jgi:hypothetical protein
MPTRDQVLAALAPDRPDYRAAAARLGIPAGQAYLIATGIPADGSQGTAPDARPGRLPGPTQQLVNPPPHGPKSDAVVHAWLRARAAKELRHP